MLGAILMGILIVTALGIPFGLTKFSGIVSLPPSIACFSSTSRACSILRL
jgi:xanthine/uracil/vitamin C permease (AzgA family)